MRCCLVADFLAAPSYVPIKLALKSPASEIRTAKNGTGSAELLDWDAAMGLHPEGASWRLPQRDELQSIVDHSCKRPAVNQTVFPATPSIQYWTSTTSGPSFAWIIFFRTGTPTWTYQKRTPFAARLVHDGR